MFRFEKVLTEKAEFGKQAAETTYWALANTYTLKDFNFLFLKECQ